MKYKIIDQRPSQFSNYTIAVIDVFDEFGNFRNMAEVADISKLSDISYVFSTSYINPNMMHTIPIGYSSIAIDVLVSRVDSSADKIIIAGLGSGTTHTIIDNKLKQSGIIADVVSIECDQTVIDLARDYWGFSGNVIHNTIENAIRQLEPESIKALYLNVYSEETNINSQTISRQREWFTQCINKLKPNGFLLINSFISDNIPEIDYLMDYSTEFNLSYCRIDYGFNVFTILTKSLT